MLEEQLKELISKMMIPVNRSTNYTWLYDNLKRHNAHHRSYHDAMRILRIMLNKPMDAIA